MPFLGRRIAAGSAAGSVGAVFSLGLEIFYFFLVMIVMIMTSSMHVLGKILLMKNIEFLMYRIESMFISYSSTYSPVKSYKKL